VGADAAAVARHYFTILFTRARRKVAQQQPPRVELVRLTNLQYLNSIADLLKEFTGKDARE